MKPIIKVENLGKKYQIGLRQESYVTIRETVAGALRAPLKRFRSNGKPSYETIWALKDVSFEVMPGEVLGIVGRNGAGKSTLLKILSRITEPTTGRVELFGRVGSLLEVGTGFHPELTGRENIYLNGAILGMSRGEIARKFDEIVAFSEIDKFLDTAVKFYSSGMYMKLAFAVAAHLEPEILIIDEVLAVGDVAFQRKCLGKMGDVAKEGRTVLFVSHGMSAISKLCSRAMLLGRGGVVEEGDTENVIDTYLREAAPTGAVESKFHPDRDIYVAEARSLDADGKPKTDFTHNETITIAVACKINRWVPDTVMGFFARDHRDRKVFTANNPEWPGLDPKTREIEMRVKLPYNFLVPGKYVFTFGITTLTGRSVDWVEDVAPITIVDGGSEFSKYEGGDYGCVFAECDWKVESA
jgi:lipopolysaccharide transport system ATP-binding protein